ncbi:MAG: DJ-1/PfpI family protein [Gammaproteobacteria bacterium]|nr:MAG: DJ-1/PfpI family protein [Gammaproteobacteria bacterium]
MNVGIYLYDNAEVLDFAGPFEVFSTANRLHSEPAFHVFLIGETGATIEARGGFQVIPAYSFNNHPPIDVLIVVGGVHTAELLKPNVLRWIGANTESAKLVASVCTGVFLLATAGVIQSETVTTHWEDIPDLRRDFPNLHIKENTPWVDQDRVVTSAGISAGIGMSLHLVSRLVSQDLAIRTARQMEFDWQLS